MSTTRPRGTIAMPRIEEDRIERRRKRVGEFERRFLRMLLYLTVFFSIVNMMTAGNHPIAAPLCGVLALVGLAVTSQSPD